VLSKSNSARDAMCHPTFGRGASQISHPTFGWGATAQCVYNNNLTFCSFFRFTMPHKQVILLKYRCLEPFCQMLIRQDKWAAHCRAEHSGKFRILTEAKQYIMTLKESKNGKYLVNSNRKTGYVGFCVRIDSVLRVYEYLTGNTQFGFKFLCTFKFSQDNLELFFGKVRRLCGCNNNPSVRQFISAYRKLIVHRDLQDVMRGNCLPLETVPILTTSSSFISQLQSSPPSVLALNHTVIRSSLIDPDETPHSDHDYAFIPVVESAELS